MAKPGDRLWRIGMLETIPEAENAVNLGAFRLGLREHGLSEGVDFTIDYRSADGRGERFARLAAELVRSKVDLIVTRGTPAALAASDATRKIPIVMASIGDPLSVVASLARPGGNITGLSSLTSDLEAKRLELLHLLLPEARRFAALYDLGNPVFKQRWKEIQRAAPPLGVQAQLLDARQPEDFGKLFDAATRQRVEGLIVGQDGLLQANRHLIASLAAKHRIPAIYVSRDFVEAGGLISYGPSYRELYRRSAGYVGKIIKGANPAELPIEQPTILELVISTSTAAALGLSIPQSLALRANDLLR